MPQMTAAEFRRQHKGHDSERDLQAAVCGALSRMGVPHYAIPNGQYRPGEAPEPGLQKGVPDLCIPIQGVLYDEDDYRAVGALYIELKQPERYTRKTQRAWLDRLTATGNACAVCRSVDEVVTLWQRYIGSPPSAKKLTKDDLWPEQR